MSSAAPPTAATQPPDVPGLPVRPARRVFSGVTPSGRLHLGNYLGAIRRWVTDQNDPGSDTDGVYCVVNLHAFTADRDPRLVADLTDEAFALLLACGLGPGDPHRGIVFVQGDVPAHTELSYLLECVTRFGEARRMTQFRERARAGRAGNGTDGVPLSLLTYPVLMAADVLLYDTTEVPVGADQAQHVELLRDLAVRFNRRYGQTFVVPTASLPDFGARVRDLRDPARKMDKSNPDQAGVVYLLDPPDVVVGKIRRSVTDTRAGMRYDPAGGPGVANLVEILAVLTDQPPERAAEGISDYARLKRAVTDAVVSTLEPIQDRYRALTADRAALAGVRAETASRAAERAGATLSRARRAMCLP